MSHYQTALVTGASSGIGRAIALELAEAGLKVLAVGRDADSLAALPVRAANIVPVVCDLANLPDLYAQTATEAIDVLVNNAGLLPRAGKVTELSEDDIDAMIDVNVRAVIKLTRHVLAGMVVRRRGHVFFTGSSAGVAPSPNASVYGATKAAVHSFAAALRCDVAGLPIRVTELVPGRVQTNLYRTALGAELAQKTLYDEIQAVQPEHLAQVLRCALDLPDYVDLTRIDIMPTGQVIGGVQTLSLTR